MMDDFEGNIVLYRLSLEDRDRLAAVLADIAEMYVDGEPHREATIELHWLILTLDDGELVGIVVESVCDLRETPVTDAIVSHISKKLNLSGEVELWVWPEELVKRLQGGLQNA
jgi:hypothetical protein